VKDNGSQKKEKKGGCCPPKGGPQLHHSSRKREGEEGREEKGDYPASAKQVKGWGGGRAEGEPSSKDNQKEGGERGEVAGPAEAGE